MPAHLDPAATNHSKPSAHATELSPPGFPHSPPPPSPASPHTIPENSRNFPPHANSPTPSSHPPRPLHPKQLKAIDYLVAGDSPHTVCRLIRIDAKTLYNWRHRNPLFIAEYNRRCQSAWNEVADDLRHLVTHALAVLRSQLHHTQPDASQVRAARTLISLVNTRKLTPTAPTSVDAVLDQLLRAESRRAQPAAPAEDAPTLTDEQRSAFLDRLLAEDKYSAAALAAHPSVTAPTDPPRLTTLTAAPPDAAAPVHYPPLDPPAILPGSPHF